MQNLKVAILAGSRLPFCRVGTQLAKLSNLDMLTLVLKNLAEKNNLQDKVIGEVALGAVMAHSDIWNLSREAVIDAGLHMSSPAIGIQRACGTSLDALITVANKIALGQIEVGIAGGSDTMSDPPIFFRKKFSRILMRSNSGRTMKDKILPWTDLRPKDLIPGFPVAGERQTGLNMGQSCEQMAKEWSISREDQDQLALKSHQNAHNSYEQGFHDDLVFEYNGVAKDNNIRPDTSMDRLSKLKPSFDKSDKGTLTAGNSSPLTDGASCLLVSSLDWAKKHGHEVLATLSFCQNAAVDFKEKEGLLMAPAYAVSQMLQKTNLKLQDFDFYEIHEAFAAQVLCTLKAWDDEKFCKEKLGLDQKLGPIDYEKLNVNGSSIAFGHPFAATGTRIVASLAKLLNQKGKGRGLISICTAGGMGTTAILEKP